MLLLGDCNDHLKDIRDNSIDLLLTDPPYGIEFMGKDWDKALVPTETWKECYRVLKEGKLAFIMCSPRQDVLSRMIVNLQDAGFRTNYTSIYWCFASGFPKAANISKLIDKKNGRTEEIFKQFPEYLEQKRLEKNLSMSEIDKMLGTNTAYSWWASRKQGLPAKKYYDKLKQILDLDDRYDELFKTQEADREIIGKRDNGVSNPNCNTVYLSPKSKKEIDITKPATEEAKKMEGAYVGFQPKPAVEVILVVSKGKTLTWLDDARIPYQNEQDKESADHDAYPHDIRGGNYCNSNTYLEGKPKFVPQEKGRFPANLLVSDDVLNDGTIHKSGKDVNPTTGKVSGFFGNKDMYYSKDANYEDSGSYSRYFSLDAWAKTFPFLIVPKASKSERNNGLDSIQPVKVNDGRNTPIDNPFQRGETLRTNSHPTIKPLKLMSYLITMGSREGDLVLDPFCGSGTVCIAAHQLHRKWLGIEMNPEYAEIIKKRLADPLAQLKLTAFV